MPNMFFHKYSGQFAVCLSIKGRQRTFYLGKDKKAAQDKYHELMCRYKKNKDHLSLPKADSLLFKALADQFLDDYHVRQSISHKTYVDYENRLSYFYTIFPDLKCNEINLSIINRFKRYLLTQKPHGLIKIKKGVSAERVNRYIGAIKRVFNWALENEILRAADVSLPKIKKEPHVQRPPRFLTRDEVQRLLSYPDSISRFCNESSRQKVLQTIAIVKFILATGRRIQEVTNIKRKDIDLSTGAYLITRDKTVKSNPRPKVFYLNKIAMDIIEPLINNCKTMHDPAPADSFRIKDAGVQEDDYIFHNPDGSQLGTHIIGKRFRKIMKRLGINGVALKELRHTFASHMLQAGETLEAVKEHLGHRSIKTTEIYSHLSKEYLKKSINNEKFNKLFSL